jgi:hypothetical protein
MIMSSAMCRLVVWQIFTNVLEDPEASIFSVKGCFHARRLGVRI